jgi:uncharacterized protein YndB with AHSA1/START domain
MKHLEFKTQIAADKKKVWDTMLQPETYKEWVSVSWPGSYYEGKWEKGENIRFLASSGGGTVAKLVDQKQYQDILAKHIAVIRSDGSEDRDSDIAKGWIGTTERYLFKEKNGTTELTVAIDTTEQWQDMFNDGWPNALAKLKEICERSN